MLQTIMKVVVGTKNQRDIKALEPIVFKILGYEKEFAALSDAALKAKTDEFKRRLKEGATLDALLPEAFAVVREAAKRTLGLRPYDVQMIGGIVLHQGKIAEMRTGEGKTLVSCMPAYLNALTGEGVHIVTVNDYLAKRDAEWMGQVHRFLGLTVGCIQADQDPGGRRPQYDCDITYGTNNEFGFDYLRDNMKFRVEDMAQRGHAFAIVDEVDSILIDEARTPLIISGPSEDNPQKYVIADRAVKQLLAGEHYEVDEKMHSVTMNEKGVAEAERLTGVANLFAAESLEILHAVNQALSAKELYKLDHHYVIQPGEEGDDEILIVDEFTGRLMHGRRWSDGLHQAVEAKEGVRIQNETQTYATITLQNYFRMYRKLAGMTGTAETEAVEFSKIYKLDVTMIPTHRAMIRRDEHDLFYASEKGKFKAVADLIAERHEAGQPVLVGTVSVEKSEALAALLKERGIRHHVLNAKQHAREAEIVAQAGRRGAVTIATNMAGRGTDILLGGNPEALAHIAMGQEAQTDDLKKKLTELRAQCAQERDEVLDAGGLFIIGTERHESRRIDNQLRGRAGRQGDPGGSRFYLSLDDDLIRIFGSDRFKAWMLRFGLSDEEPLEHKMVTRSIERAQEQVEGRNFEQRKHLLEYDNVMNRQREAVYGLRQQVLAGEALPEWVQERTDLVIGDFAARATGPDGRSFDGEAFTRECERLFGIHLEPQKTAADGEAAAKATCEAKFAERRKGWGERLVQFLRGGILHTLDRQWKDHLLTIDHLKAGINLRGYGQKDPVVEYKREALGLFETMMARIEEESLLNIYRVEPPTPEQEAAAQEAQQRAREEWARRQQQELERRQREQQRLFEEAARAAGAASGGPQAPVRKTAEAGRNEPCPCGSGKKYKKCHGA